MSKLILIFLACLGVANAATDYAKLSPVTNFQANEYLGSWYEVARIPFYWERNCIAPITANYSLNATNNAILIVKNTCNTVSGKSDIANGEALFVSESSIGHLKVGFAPSFRLGLGIGYGDYQVIDTDYTTYSLVGSENRKYLWILSRNNKLDANTFDRLVNKAKSLGFEVSGLIINN